MMYSGDNMGTGGWVFSILVTLILLALIVAAIVWLLSARRDRDRDRDRSISTPRESANDTLDRRLASGELTAAQYEQLRKMLSDTHPRTSASVPNAERAVARR